MKKPTNTYELLIIGYSNCMCGGVKWKNMMFTASSVRTPVSAGNCGLRTGAAERGSLTKVAVAFKGGPSVDLVSRMPKQPRIAQLPGA